jgi:hypothetical protein
MVLADYPQHANAPHASNPIAVKNGTTQKSTPLSIASQDILQLPKPDRRALHERTYLVITYAHGRHHRQRATNMTGIG